MRRADIISAAVVALVGLAVMLVVIPRWIPGHEDGAYGLQPADFPFVTILVATVLAAGFFAWRATRPAREDEPPAPLEGFHWVFLAIVLLVLIAAFLLFSYLGFLAGGPFVIAVFMFMMGERRVLPIAVTAAAVPVALWGFFWKLLEFPLP